MSAAATEKDFGEAIVVSRELYKRYGDVVALRSLDLEVPRGSIFGLLGPNGAGKSTTFGILCGWLRATGGDATVMGVDCRDLYKLRGRVAALPQDAQFPPRIGVRDQLVHFGRLMGMSSNEAGLEADRALEKVAMTAASKERGSDLSHGMLKRIGIAQSLLGSPDVLFLDEPTSGLDPQNARRIKDLLPRLAPSTTVIVSSHNLSDVQEVCTHGAILSRGELVAVGEIESLTRAGQEITIEVAEEAQPPLDALRAAFGAESVVFEAPEIRILFDSREQPEDVIAGALRLLLDANTPILRVQRGTSLETTFLEITQ